MPARLTRRSRPCSAHLGRLGLAVYRATAATHDNARPTAPPAVGGRDLIEAMVVTAGMMALVGGRTGRRAALNGIAALAIDSAAVNIVGKLWFRRQRPDRGRRSGVASRPDADLSRSRRDMRHPASPSPRRSARSHPASRCQSGCWRRSWPTHECIPVCTIPATSSPARSIGSSIGEAVGLGARRICGSATAAIATRIES